MGNAHLLIKNEYDRRQKEAMGVLEARTREVYSQVPTIEEIDSEIKLSGIRYNKLILLEGGRSNDLVLQLSSRIDSLKAERQELLEKSGFPANYLQPVYRCSRCSDTGYVESNGYMEKCSCYKQQLIEHLYSGSNTKLTENENFSTFDETYYSGQVDVNRYKAEVSPRENIVAIKERCHGFIENFDSTEEKNLFFSGPTGVGKTFMTNCIAKELLDKGRTVLYQTAPVLFNTITEYRMKAYRDEDFEVTGYRNIFDAELLIIDDLGTEPQSASRYAELLTILDTRQSNNLIRPCKTIISTNIGAKKLLEFYTERVVSRIMGSFDRLMFIGDDIRNLKR